MSLFTDDYCITVDELVDTEPSLLQEATEYGRGVTLQVSDVIAETVGEVQATLDAHNIAYYNNNLWPSMNGVSGNHYAGLWAGMAINRSVLRVRTSQIVVSAPTSSTVSLIKTWTFNLALMNFYKRLAGRMAEKEDRFGGRRDYYASQSYRHLSYLRSVGIPYLDLPMPAPGAIMEPNAGLWGLSSLSSVSSSGTLGGTYWVCITWVQEGRQLYVSPYDKGNAESGPSRALFFQVDAGNLLSISTLGLNPPQLNNKPGYYSGQTMHATGWNVYIAASDQNISTPSLTSFILQNLSPLPVTVLSWTLPADPITTGPTLTSGQAPLHTMASPGPMMMRG